MIGNGLPKSITQLLLIRADLEKAIVAYQAALELVTDDELFAQYSQALARLSKNLLETNTMIHEEVARERASRTAHPE